MKYVGVDGCKGGWFAVCLGNEGVRWSLHTTCAEIIANYNQAQRFFVDIPIGLPASGIREADSVARSALPPHLKSSIFNTPVRRAVYASSKALAQSVNRKLTGKSLSQQSLGITKKIKEVDLLLQDQPELRNRVYESHPEIGFIRLAGKNTKYRKKDLLGGLERLRIIEQFVPNVENILMEVRKRHALSTVASDDILDAFALALSARECKGTPKFFPGGKKTPPTDETGLPMAIWHA